ncbi:MAG: 2-amino-4-hydroxy-6-hydroxymethyldihydropteridine diphosphokinase [Clostridiales bacterium]|nr:2-amino-4-hydroxy-6-hydroxymethyldihydropteridine diphosphokinase [Clostridiales bacterium]
MEYVLSLGTNIGDRKGNIEKAIESLALLSNTHILKRSPIYETEPVGFAFQEKFYNIAVTVESFFEPGEMFGACLGIEAALGRVRNFKNGPRIIDIDIIFAQDNIINTKNLTVPHPRYSERLFVLVPLLELFSDGIVYGTDIKPYVENLKDNYDDVKRVM